MFPSERTKFKVTFAVVEPGLATTIELRNVPGIACASRAAAPDPRTLIESTIPPAPARWSSFFRFIPLPVLTIGADRKQRPCAPSIVPSPRDYYDRARSPDSTDQNVR